MEGLFESGSGVVWRSVAVAFAESYSRAFPGVSVPVRLVAQGGVRSQEVFAVVPLKYGLITSVSVFSEFHSQSSDTCNGLPGSLFSYLSLGILTRSFSPPDPFSILCNSSPAGGS